MNLDPKLAGLSPERLHRITDHLTKNYVAPGKIAGCQALVARHGHVAYFQSLGNMDRERARPMGDDTIFRIYSMSKPITSVALMALYERGHFQLNNPVYKVIPEWRDHRVWVSGEGDSMETREPTQPMTFRHVLSHTGGLTYGATRHPVDRAYRAAGIRQQPGETLRSFVEKLARVPLRYDQLAIVPYFASVHDERITTCDTATATAAIIHHRGEWRNCTAAMRRRTVARSQRPAIGREIGWESCGRSAHPKALAGPNRWMRPCSTNSATKIQRNTHPPQRIDDRHQARYRRSMKAA